MNNIVGNLSYANQTTVNLVGLVILLISGVCLLSLPRRWAIFPMLVMACFVSSAQRIVVFNLDFNYLRILVLFGVFRVIIKNEFASFKWCRLDKAVILWAVSSALLYTVRLASLSGLINRLGFCFDAIGMYLLFRCLIQNWGDVDRIIKGLFWISLPLCVFFIIENRTGRNMFSIFGGVSPITVVRYGRLRCQGAFSHPILAGCFWASVFPLFAVLWWKSNQGKVWAVVGSIAAWVIVVCCASSTPVFSVLCGMLGGALFYYRRQMNVLRWMIVGVLVTLHAAMTAPVWHLISRVSAVGGSTGYHRYILIDQAINHFSDWALIGCSGYTVLSWGIHMGDVTNQYVFEGVNGGVVALCLFVYCIVIASGEIGKLWRSQRLNSYELKLAWALGVSLFAHCMNFLGVSYFGQISILWYMLLAIIGSLSIARGKRKRSAQGLPV